MKRTAPTPLRRLQQQQQRGLTLVELLVAIVIAMVVVLAATNVVVIGEAHKRTTSSTNDANQSGSFAAYALDRAVRSAGSGFVQAWDQGVFGCKLSAARKIGATTTTLLPRASTFPAPFQGFLAAAPESLVLAPILIGQNMSAGGSDVLMVMSGNGSSGDVARPVRGSVTGGIRLDNTIGLADGDIGLVTQPGTGTTCLLEQVAVTDEDAFKAIGNDALPIGGEFANTGDLAAAADTTTASFSVLGNAAAKNVQFQLFGVDANRTLVAYDLLRSTADATNADPIMPIAEGVSEMRALYGIDTSADNIVDSWVAPTGDWAIASLLTQPAKMRQIVAVRLVVVMRSTNYEKEEVSAERPALFAGTAAQVDAVAFPANSEERHFRLRVIDTTIPLRNMLLLPTS